MTQDDHDPPTCDDAARQRVIEITGLFTEMRTLMTRWLRDAGPAADATSKQMMTKISELQTAHLVVLRAEEAFHDKFGHGDIADSIDYDAARRDIGRALDRLRVAFDAKCVSERSDDGSD